MTFFISRRHRQLFFSIVFACSAYLACKGLAYHLFWDDEGITAFLARNFARTGTMTGYDGRNLLTFRDGTLLNEELNNINPPMEYLVIALSFKIFGYTTWAGRLPFVIFGLATLAVFWLLLRTLFPAMVLARIYGFVLLAFSCDFLLNIRQCRYYALGIFFGALSLLLYYRAVQLRRLRDFALLAGSLILLFLSQYLIALAFVIALASLHLLFYRRDFSRSDWWRAAAVGGPALFLLVLYAVAWRIWERPDIQGHHRSITGIARKLVLLFLNFREADTVGYLPALVIIPLGIVLWRRRKSLTWERRYVECLFLSAVYIWVIALFSPQPTQWGGFTRGLADFRYLTPLLPLGAMLTGGFCVFVHRSLGGAVGAATALCMLFTNFHTLNMANFAYQWTLPGYLREIHVDYETATEAVVAYLDSTAKRDEIVFTDSKGTVPANSLLFYLSDKLYIGGLLHARSHLPREKVESLNGYHYRDSYFPHYVVAYGIYRGLKKQLDSFSRDRYTYSMVKRLNVYWSDYVLRPGIPYHHFRPNRAYDPKTSAVYVFKRTLKDTSAAPAPDIGES